MARINEHLDSNCKYYLSSGKAASSSKSEQKDAWSKLLDGKKSGKEKSAYISRFIGGANALFYITEKRPMRNSIP